MSYDYTRFYTDAEIDEFWERSKPTRQRLVRAVTYCVIAYVLIRLNTYGVAQAEWIALTVGALGVGTASARVSLLAIALLLVMAIVPASVVSGVLCHG